MYIYIHIYMYVYTYMARTHARVPLFVHVDKVDHYNKGLATVERGIPTR